MTFNHIYNGIYLGSVSALKQIKKVQEMGIRAILRLDSALLSSWPEDRFVVMHMPIYDGKPIDRSTLLKGTGFIHQQMQSNRKILVHCQMGISRSATFVIAYLIEYKNMTLAEAYYVTRSARLMAHPHHALLNSLVEHYELPFPTPLPARIHEHLYEKGQLLIAEKAKPHEHR